MEIDLKTRFSSIVVVLLGIVAFILLALWISKTYLADLVGRRPVLADIELGAKLDPGDSDYQLRLARLYQYQLSAIDPEKALLHLRRAAESCPRDPQAWTELGSALQQQGRNAEAEAALRRADALAPNLPTTQWTIGNFFLLQGDTDEAFRHFRFVLPGNAQYHATIFDTAWKASGDSKKILDELIPTDAYSEFSYLYYLFWRQRFPAALELWHRIVKDHDTFLAEGAAGYLDSLFRAGRFADADEVWNDMRRKRVIDPAYEQTSQNLIINGNFEQKVLNLGYDWHIFPATGAYTSIDQTTFHSPTHSVLIQFTGKENIEYRHLFQPVRVNPGRTYRLNAFMKTEGITTDSGPRIEVHDISNPLGFKLTEGLTETSTGWTPVSLDLKTGPNAHLLFVSVVRLPSGRIDNLIAGKVWIDDVTLTEASGRE